MKYSNTYLAIVLLGVLCTIGVLICLYEQHSPTLAAILTVSAFIFLWVPQMFPDEDKYREHRYTGNEKRHRENSGSN